MQNIHPLLKYQYKSLVGLLFTFTLYYARVVDDNLPLHFVQLSVHGLLQLSGHSFHSINKAQ